VLELRSYNLDWGFAGYKERRERKRGLGFLELVK